MVMRSAFPGSSYGAKISLPNFNHDVRAEQGKKRSMKSDIEKTINGRVSAAFSDLLPESSNKHTVLKAAQDMVHAVWTGKIYAKLPKDKQPLQSSFWMRNLSSY